MKKFLFCFTGIALFCFSAWAEQSCNWAKDSKGIQVWRCKDTENGKVTSLSESNDDFTKFYDANMNIQSYILFDNTRDKYGNKTKVISSRYDANDNLMSTTKEFYTYTDNSRKKYTWDDTKYQTLKEIEYDSIGTPIRGKTITYSGDGLEVTFVEKYYAKGQLVKERGYTYSSVCPYDQMGVSSKRFRRCKESRSLKGSWITMRHNDKIFSKTYYSDWFETILYTMRYEYNKDNSYQIKYSDGRIEKYDVDGKKLEK